MSFWEENKLEEKITEILSDIEYRAKPDHHFGIPFVSPYQIAFKLDIAYPDLRQKLGLPIGGRALMKKHLLHNILLGSFLKGSNQVKSLQLKVAFFQIFSSKTLYLNTTTKRLLLH